MPTIKVDGAELYFEEHGCKNAPALVLAHGMGGNHAIWFKQLPILAERYRVIAFDHRGFGNSIDLTGEGRDAYVEDLRAILDYLVIERAILLGQSMGGGTCIAFSCTYPERVISLVVSDSLHALVESPDVKAIMDEARAATRDLGQIDRVLGKRMQKEEPIAAVLYQQINSFNAVTRHNLKGSLPRFEPAQLAKGGFPVLFIAGVEDVLFPIEAIRRVQQQITGSKLVELANTGHSAFYESPKEFNAIVVAALEEII